MSRNEKRKVRELIQQHYAAGGEALRLHEVLAAAGIMTKYGKPFTKHGANTLAVRMGLRKKAPFRRQKAEARRPAAQAPKPVARQLKRPPSCPDTALAILTDPKLGCEKKVAMLTAYYQ